MITGILLDIIVLINKDCNPNLVKTTILFKIKLELII